MKGIKWFFCFLLFPCALSAQEDTLTLKWLKDPGVFYLQWDTGYYYTEYNYGGWFERVALGQTQSPTGLSFFQYMDWDLGLAYNVREWLQGEVFAHGSYFARSGDGSRSHKSSFSIYRLGGALRSQQKGGGGSTGFGFIEEFSFSFPVRQLKAGAFRPVADPLSMHFTPSLWAYLSFYEVFYPFVHLGFKVRTRALSALLQFKAGLTLRLGLSELGTYVYGFYSALKGKDLSQKGHLDLLVKLNGGSLKFASQDPGVVGGLAYIKWYFPYFTLRMAGDMDFNGTSYAKGYRFSLSLTFQQGKLKDLESLFETSPELPLIEQ